MKPHPAVYLFDEVMESAKHHFLLCLFLPVSQRSKISQGSKALSHDSVFVSEASEATEALGASQDSIHGKVKSLQVNERQFSSTTLRFVLQKDGGDKQ